MHKTNNSKGDKIKNYILQNLFCILIIVILLIGFGLVYYIAPFKVLVKVHSSSKIEEIGSFLSGYVGSIFTLISVILLYLTFNSQRSQNKLENFERKYYAMLELHRKNVEEIKIQEHSGRVVFVRILEEFRYILKIVNYVIKQQKPTTISDKERFEICYYALFFGVGDDNTQMLRQYLSRSYSLIADKVIDLMIEARNINTNSSKIKGKFKNKYYVNKLFLSSIGKCFKEELGYIPFDGHQSRLGHYFRHLYQVVMLVNACKIITQIEKMNYIKTIRAQLSIYEQAIFFISCMSGLGETWNKPIDLVTTYALIKNIPQYFFNPECEIDIKKQYPDIIFEYEELNGGNNGTN